MIDPNKDNFIQPITIKEILDEFETFKEIITQPLPILKYENLVLHLKKKLNSCFINNFFDVGLKAWLANMDIQPLLKGSDMCMFQYFNIS